LKSHRESAVRKKAGQYFIVEIFQYL
jgi:hypothetical protein